ncbi:Gfo/Idh/MocA family protein [Ammoniphilus sp. YIM 78166]|uniref:Gfo/Idh/MocA family protein n=1 Tax=Ammoniphilus sp. YIM 78166 TaxID=1644106 RepID=UPI00106FC97A|nr:Gfo/Idh/MocA family oxidoreductase [Ammoniphilus sp. YIM 78166]
MQKVRWGILSTAGIARRQLIPALQKEPGSEITAIASLSGKAREVADEFGIPRAYDSYEELLQDPDIQVVYIPLPNALHQQWAIMAAQHHKHILCEKPATLHADEMNAVIEACQQHQVLFMEAFMYQFHPQHEKVKALVRSGAIGEVRLFRAAFSFAIGDQPDNIRLNKELGGGSLYDVGCYGIHSLRYILEDEPEQVFAMGKIDPASGVDTLMTLSLKMQSGVHALVDCNFEIPNRQEYEVIGTKGRIHVPRAYRPDLAGGEGLIRLHHENGEVQELLVEGDQYLLQVQHLADCIRKGIEPSYPPSNTLQNMRVIDAAYSSLREGKSIYL